MQKALILWLLAVVAGSRLTASEPRSINSPADGKTGQGMVRLSVRSQTQLGGTLHLWFAKVSANPAGKDGFLRFERKQGVPLAGTNTIDSKPKFYSLAPGAYRLIAHVVNCEDLPPPGSTCVLTIGSNRFEQPTGRYGDTSVEFDVLPGKLTDAGEFILELPPETELGKPVSVQESSRRIHAMAVRWRKIAAPLPAQFASLGLGDTPRVPDGFKSNLRCETKPEDAKGMRLYYPFDC